MFRGFLSLLVAGSTVTMALPPQQPAEVYHNRTTVENPQVNAVNVVNDGDITAFSSIPWDSQNTVNFTNRGSMFGSIGFRFETVTPPFGFRTPANSFFNDGSISAQDSGGFALIIDGTGGSFNNSQTSLIKVNANNITNRGVLNVGANGFIQLRGRNVDLKAGAMIVGDIDDPLSGGGFGGGLPSQFDTNFFPAAGIYDLAWGIGSYTNARVGNVITTVDPSTVSTPTPAPILTNASGFGSSAPIFLDEATLWSRIEVIDETNEVIQLIAVQVSDPSIGIAANFVSDTYWDPEPLGGYLTAMVELRVGATDFSTLERITNSLYIFDQLGASTNRSLMENNFFGTFRPGNFVVFRDLPGLFGEQMVSTNVRDDILTAHVEGTNDPVAYVNTIFTNDWAGYRAQVESVAERLPVVPGAVVTNLGGQVEVNAQQLNLWNTRIRGEGFVTLTATNVTIGGSNIVDSPRLSFNFGSGSGNLEVNEFVPDSVERFNGTFTAYSTVFTNFYERYVTNTPADPADTNITIVTNPVEVRFQVTIVDARGLQTTEQVTVYDVKLTSTNGPSSIIFNESLTVANSLTLDTRELTFSPGSSLSLFGDATFSYTNMLNVRTLTNHGSLFSLGLADFRSREFRPYDSFVNTGAISADGVDIWANEFMNSGSIVSQTLLTIRGGTLVFDSGLLDAGLDLRLSGESITLANLQVNTAGRFVLDAAQTLTDRGVETPNLIVAENGIAMTPTRPTGDLLGTAVVLAAQPLDFVDFVWSADDREASVNGYQNNLALGALVLDGGNLSVFEFRPAREGAALYVDSLEISGFHAENIANLTNNLVLEMNIYYSDVVSTNEQITAESLNRIFGPDAPFNLIWVPEFVGPGDVEVTLGQNGAVRRMNRALRQSMVLDSDGDGIPNALDPYPLTAEETGEQAMELVNVSRNAANDSIVFNVSGSGAVSFVIEHTTDLVTPDWKAITGTLDASKLGALQSFTDKIGEGSSQGYYRIKIVP